MNNNDKTVVVVDHERKRDLDEHIKPMGQDLKDQHRGKAFRKMQAAMKSRNDPAAAHRKADEALRLFIISTGDAFGQSLLADYDLLKSRFWYE